MKDILDPKKLSAGAGAPASGPEGSRPGHGHATTKWQVQQSLQLIEEPNDTAAADLSPTGLIWNDRGSSNCHAATCTCKLSYALKIRQCSGRNAQLNGMLQAMPDWG